MVEILFFAAANRSYEDYAPLYAFSALRHVPDSAVEIGVEDPGQLNPRTQEALGHVGSCFGKHRILVRPVPWTLRNGNAIFPNTVRFLTMPKLKARYVYIGDIDIIILERKMLSLHLSHMRKTGLGYSNSVRPGTKRMSGLHFSRFDAYYPIPDVSDLNLRWMNDEMVLHEIVKRKNLRVQNQAWYRPVHGIHISPHRPPERCVDTKGNIVPSWGIAGYARQWMEMATDSKFQKLRGLLSKRVQDALKTVDRIARSTT